jgi:RNA polymerase sigma-70 factor (ECF subfamily)
MEENHPSERRTGARSIPAAIDAGKVREQLTGLLPRLRRFARALARSPIEADDLVQAAVVRALARAEQLRAQPRPLPWLLALLARAWTEETPARRRQARTFNIEQAAEGVSDGRRELLLLQDALSRLQEEQHRAVALVLVEGLSYREAAETEGVALSVLASRLLRGRQALQRLLGAPEPGGAHEPADETLMAYVDGELETPARTRLEAARSADDTLGLRIEALRAQAERLRRTFDWALEEPVPERLLAVARSAPTLQRRNNIVPLRRKTVTRRWSWTQAGILAAALAVGVVLGVLLPRAWSGGGTFARGQHGGLLADRALARALTTQLTGDAVPPVLIGASFRARSGAYCRSFALREGSVLTGLACREPDGWRVRLLAEARESPADAMLLPAGLSRSLQEELGAPLDLKAEAAARAAGWKP